MNSNSFVYAKIESFRKICQGLQDLMVIDPNDKSKKNFEQQKKKANDFVNFAARELTLFGSQKTIKIFGQLRREGGGEVTLQIAMRFLLSLREDLGHVNDEIGESEILDMYFRPE